MPIAFLILFHSFLFVASPFYSLMSVSFKSVVTEFHLLVVVSSLLLDSGLHVVTIIHKLMESETNRDKVEIRPALKSELIIYILQEGHLM